MMRFTFKLVALLMPITPAAAHDVWMQPDRFNIPVADTVNYRVLVGHGTFRSAWDVPIDRVLLMQSIGPRGKATLKPKASSAGALSFAEPGTYVVTMTSGAVVSDLPALRFNDYAKAEGLQPALQLRARLGQTQQNGRELYSRRTKMLVRVGATGAPQPQVTTPAGLSLEIVPLRNPLLVPAGTPLPVRILYFGRPLAGATVKLTNLDADAEPVAKTLTGPTGEAVFQAPGRGRWQINVIWTRPLLGHRDAEFETIFSSLSFGQ